MVADAASACKAVPPHQNRSLNEDKLVSAVGHGPFFGAEGSAPALICLWRGWPELALVDHQKAGIYTMGTPTHVATCQPLSDKHRNQVSNKEQSLYARHIKISLSSDEASALTGPSHGSEWDKSARAGFFAGDAKLEDVPQELMDVSQALLNTEPREPGLKLPKGKSH